MSIPELHQLFLNSEGVFTDTRKVIPQGIFFSLKGANFNGNTYASQAIEKGAAFAIIDEKKYQLSDQHILVPDALTCLQKLASFHRAYLKTPIIALTGSNGKTTTKELINAVLSTRYRTTATSGNLNNHIGVPLTLLSMNQDTEIGIVEMGANHLEEINFLCEITQPDYGYITNIGKAHLEGFGGIEGVLKGKTELYRHLHQYNKIIFLNADDPILVEAAKGIQSYTFSQKSSSNLNIKLLQAKPMVTIDYNNSLIKSKLIGTYNFTNIAAAVCIGTFFKINIDDIKKAIQAYIPDNNRSQIMTKGKNTIILDAYNANPSSMVEAVKNFHQFEAANKILFLGDMFELGNVAEKEHQALVNFIEQSGFENVYLLGSHFYKTSSKNPTFHQFETFEDLKENFIKPQTPVSILIKGSRGMQLERVLDLL